jgi:protein-tyrosine-phosphatase
VLAALLREQAARRGVDAHITSSGLDAREGAPLLPVMTDAWHRHGRPPLQHRSMRYDPAEAKRAEVTLVFETAQRSQIVREQPLLVERVFTAREATRLLSSPRWDEKWSGSSFVVTRLHRLRSYVDPGDDDTPDPARMRRAAARRLLTELERSAELLGAAFFGPVGAQAPSSAGGPP